MGFEKTGRTGLGDNAQPDENEPVESTDQSDEKEDE